MPLKTDSITLRNWAPVGSGAVSTTGPPPPPRTAALCSSMRWNSRLEMCHEAPSQERYRCYGASGADQAPSPLEASTERPMPQRNDLSRSDTPLEQQSTLVAVVEMSQSSWLVAGIVPGLERHPLKKLAPDED